VRAGSAWNDSASFGGVVAFIILAYLIVRSIIDIYRRYRGWRMALFLLRAI
jgi:uncharacterized protein